MLASARQQCFGYDSAPAKIGYYSSVVPSKIAPAQYRCCLRPGKAWTSVSYLGNLPSVLLSSNNYSSTLDLLTVQETTSWSHPITMGRTQSSGGPESSQVDVKLESSQVDVKLESSPEFESKPTRESLHNTSPHLCHKLLRKAGRTPNLLLSLRSLPGNSCTPTVADLPRIIDENLRWIRGLSTNSSARLLYVYIEMIVEEALIA